MTGRAARLTRPTVTSTTILTGATAALLTVETGLVSALVASIILGALSALITKEPTS